MNQKQWRGILALVASCAYAQTPSAPTVSQVVPFATVTNSTLQPVTLPPKTFTPITTGTIKNALFSVYTDAVDPAISTPGKNVPTSAGINDPSNYQVAHAAALSSALNANIATSLSLIPLSSPTSGVILKKDALTGADLPASGTLGPIFTQRAETVGKGSLYVGVSYQNYHFTSLDGTSLNGLPLLYQGGNKSAIDNGTAKTAPATFNMGLDVRLSQELAFITYGVTDRFDISLGLPSVHAAVAARSYDGVVYSGTGLASGTGNQCWCVNSLTPGSVSLTQKEIGSARLSKTGFGDLALRFKGQVIERPHLSLAVGMDLRLPTGDEKNYLGTGTTSAKPFFALSLYSHPFPHGIVFAPHVDAGWQFSGKSILGGTFTPSATTEQLDNGLSVTVPTAPLTFKKDFLPDVFAWSGGTEIGLGRRNTLIVDIIGNEIGTIHGIQLLKRQTVDTAQTAAPTAALLAGIRPAGGGFVDGGRGSYGQYSGSFGYKVKVYRNLVASFQALVRFDDNGLTARFVPLFGLGYSR